jgi:hypothetical protein
MNRNSSEDTVCIQPLVAGSGKYYKKRSGSIKAENFLVS